MNNRTLGLILLSIGFMGAAFFATATQKSVNWLYYGLTFAVGIAGVVLLRLSARSAGSSSEKLSQDIETLNSAIDQVVAELDRFVANREATDVYDVHGQIDERLMAQLNDFVEARESMIPLYGLNGYAEVMTRFANGERMLNRAWSASADGYIDEVWKCIDAASTHMGDVRQRLQSLKTSAAAA